MLVLFVEEEDESVDVLADEVLPAPTVLSSSSYTRYNHIRVRRVMRIIEKKEELNNKKTKETNNCDV